MRSEWEANRAIDRYADLVRRVCMIHLKNHADTEDIFQTVFLKYVTGTTEFESEEHEKAWIIRVTINACKDLLRSFFRSRTVSLDDLLEQPDQVPEDHRECWKRCWHYRTSIGMWSICTIMKAIRRPRSEPFCIKTPIPSIHC